MLVEGVCMVVRSYCARLARVNCASTSAYMDTLIEFEIQNESLQLTVLSHCLPNQEPSCHPHPWSKQSRTQPQRLPCLKVSNLERWDRVPMKDSNLITLKQHSVPLLAVNFSWSWMTKIERTREISYVQPVSAAPKRWLG